MGSESSFRIGARYDSYVKETDEKTQLHNYLRREYLQGNLPIKPRDTIPKRVLDLGCGTGANLEWLLDLFRGHSVEGIDRSKSQLELIEIDDAPTRNISFEDLNGRNHDFILASHVLQYIDTNPKRFISKVAESLNSGGEAWFVQQTRKGMYQIIESVREHLDDSRFGKWNSFEDYVEMIDELGISYSTTILPTSFAGINFKEPSPNDKLRLEFMLGLDQGYDVSPEELKKSLASLRTRERIDHPNGIIKIRR